MKFFLVVLLIGFSASLFSQELDINTKRGYGASGYDVVAYFSNTAKKGSKKFTTTHNGIKYKFTSEENLTIFKSNPDKFLPQYGGYCAYAVGKRNIKMKVDPETFKVIDGKLYLFYNSWGTNTMKLWDKNHNIKPNPDTNWKKLRYKE